MFIINCGFRYYANNIHVIWLKIFSTPLFLNNEHPVSKEILLHLSPTLYDFKKSEGSLVRGFFHQFSNATYWWKTKIILAILITEKQISLIAMVIYIEFSNFEYYNWYWTNRNIINITKQPNFWPSSYIMNRICR